MRTQLALVLVRLVCRLLPSDVRARYTAELIAELYDLPPSRRLLHAWRFAIRIPALRHAVAESARPGYTSPWHCRLLFHHRYVATATDDGARYLRCRVCGQDDPAVRQVNDSVAWAGVVAANGR